MRRRVIASFVVAVVLSLPISLSAQPGPPFPPPGPPSTSGPTPQGFSTLLCLADALLGGASLEMAGDTIVLFGGQVKIEARTNVTTSMGVSQIDVRLTHGDSFSDHTIRFIDNTADGALNCGDTIVAVL